MSAAAGKRRRRWLTALFLASIAAWLVYTAAALLSGLTDRQAGTVDLALAIAVLGFPVGLAICLIVGLPALLVAEALRLSRWWQAAMLGAVAGLIAFAVVMAAFGASWGALNAVLFVRLLIFGLVGASAGVIAWASLWLDGKYASPRSRPARP